MRTGELRRAANAAVVRVENAEKALMIRSSSVLAPSTTLPGDARARNAIQERRAVLLDLGRLLAKDASNLPQHVDESRPAEARIFRKIRAAPDWLAFRRQEHGERPTALLAQRMQRVHVDLVDVGPFLAVDLDVDEELVHHHGSGGIFEALVRHDMAPVAGA